ncbi:hypothetical protein ACMFMF_004670 [Clarireedia jacksonii]
MSYGYNNAENGYGGNNYGGASPGYAQSPQYNNGPAMGRDSFGGQNVEMESLAQNGSQFGQQSNTTAILNECREVNRGISGIQDNLNELKMLQRSVINSTEPSALYREIDGLSSKTMATYRELTLRVRKLKSNPDSGNSMTASQVGKLGRDLKAALTDYQKVESAFRKDLQEQMARQYKIVHPEVSDEEARNATADLDNQQIFTQELMQSSRSQQANTTLRAVQDRSAAIRKIEQQMIEVAELFTQMEQLVEQQEAAVVNIEQKGEEVVENMDKGVEQIDTAIVSARSRNRKKWWCLGICVLIVIIIVIIVLIYKFVIQNNSSSNNNNNTNKSAKRSIIPELVSAPVVPGSEFKESSKAVVPGLEWKGSKLVVPGASWKGEAVVPGAVFTEVKAKPVVRKWKKFVA